MMVPFIFVYFEMCTARLTAFFSFSRGEVVSAGSKLMGLGGIHEALQSVCIRMSMFSFRTNSKSSDIELQLSTAQSS